MKPREAEVSSTHTNGRTITAAQGFLRALLLSRVETVTELLAFLVTTGLAAWTRSPEHVVLAVVVAAYSSFGRWLRSDK